MSACWLNHARQKTSRVNLPDFVNQLCTHDQPLFREEPNSGILSKERSGVIQAGLPNDHSGGFTRRSFWRVCNISMSPDVYSSRSNDKCDLLVGVFWTRIGTTTGEYVCCYSQRSFIALTSCACL